MLRIVDIYLLEFKNYKNLRIVRIKIDEILIYIYTYLKII